jgi:peptidoglycan/LPS O-acetylase OafA/YrhL
LDNPSNAFFYKETKRLRSCSLLRKALGFLGMPEKKSPASLQDHLPRLDVLRGVAILFVVFFHLLVMADGWRIPWNGLWADLSAWHYISYPLLPLMWGGLLGVPLFFVLSGFCIHYAFLRRGKSLEAKNFYWHRFLRLYPAYFTACVVYAALVAWLPYKLLSYKYENIYQLPVHLLLVHNLNKSTFMGINGAFWSLGVEFQFYLLYPLLLLMRRKWDLRVCLVISLGINIALQLYNSLTRHIIDPPVSVEWSFPLVTWCDWIMGACLAEAYVAKRRLFSQWWLMLLVCAVFFVGSQMFKSLHVQSFLFSSALFAVLMDRYIPDPRPLTRIERAIVPIGLVSYSVYLWHMPIVQLTGKLADYLGLPTTTLAVLGLYLPFILIFLVPISWLSYAYLEVKFLRYFKKKKLDPAASDAPQVTLVQ